MSAHLFASGLSRVGKQVVIRDDTPPSVRNLHKLEDSGLVTTEEFT